MSDLAKLYLDAVSVAPDESLYLHLQRTGITIEQERRRPLDEAVARVLDAADEVVAADCRREPAMGVYIAWLEKALEQLREVILMKEGYEEETDHGDF